MYNYYIIDYSTIDLVNKHKTRVEVFTSGENTPSYHGVAFKKFL
jgi:hypothetical protein